MKKLFARVEARHLGNVSEAVEKWESILAEAEKYEAASWSEYIDLLKSVQDEEELTEEESVL